MSSLRPAKSPVKEGRKVSFGHHDDQQGSQGAGSSDNCTSTSGGSDSEDVQRRGRHRRQPGLYPRGRHQQQQPGPIAFPMPGFPRLGNQRPPPPPQLGSTRPGFDSSELLPPALGSSPGRQPWSIPGAPLWQPRQQQQQQQQQEGPLLAGLAGGAAWGPAAWAQQAPQAAAFLGPPCAAMQQQQQQQPQGAWPQTPALPPQPPPGLSLLYDGTTHEAVLADDVMARELQREGHELVQAQDAYHQRMAALQAAVNGDVLTKRNLLRQQHARLSARVSEVAAVRVRLEREVGALAAGMAERLRAGEAAKVALLTAEQREVERDLQGLQHLVGQVTSASHAGVVDFLNVQHCLLEACHGLAAKAPPADCGVVAEDLPPEARPYAELREAHAALHKLLAVKDGMIEHLLAERSALQEDRASLEAHLQRAASGRRVPDDDEGEEEDLEEEGEEEEQGGEQRQGTDQPQQPQRRLQHLLPTFRNSTLSSGAMYAPQPHRARQHSSSPHMQQGL